MQRAAGRVSGGPPSSRTSALRADSRGGTSPRTSGVERGPPPQTPPQTAATNFALRGPPRVDKMPRNSHAGRCFHIKGSPDDHWGLPPRTRFGDWLRARPRAEVMWTRPLGAEAAEAVASDKTLGHLRGRRLRERGSLDGQWRRPPRYNTPTTADKRQGGNAKGRR